MQILRIILLLGTLFQKPTLGDTCLAAYSTTDKYIIRIPSGAITSSPLILDNSLSGFILPGAISPDGRRVAQIALTEEKPDRFVYQPSLPIQLSIKILQHPFVRAQIENMNHPYISSDIEVQWSPDSQWLAYRWQTPSLENYIALADANGKTLKQEKLGGKPPESFQFDAWSPDSKYLTVLRHNFSNPETKYITYDLSFWTTPDLRNVTPQYEGYILADSCETSTLVDEVYCVNWSGNGHYAAFVTHSKSDISLVFASLDSSSIQSFSIPRLQENAESRRIFVAWSSNNKQVAVTRGSYVTVDPNNNYQNGSEYLYVSALHIFGIDGTSQMNIDQNAVSAEYRGEGPDVIQWKSSNNGKTLYYIRYNPSQKSIFEAVSYNVDTRQKQVLLSFSSINIYVEFYPSPDNNSVGLFMSHNGPEDPIFYWVNSKGRVLQKMNFDARPSGISFAWSSTPSPFLAVIETMPDETLSNVAGKFSIKTYQANGVLLVRHIFNFVGTYWQQPEWVSCP